MNSLENYFFPYREGIIGTEHKVSRNNQSKSLIYADWTASGRLYEPIERYINQELGPYIANTHTESNETSRVMTKAYHEAQDIIKAHVNADDNDILLFTGNGSTAAVNKLQRLMALKGPRVGDEPLPVVFVTHMEHYSNHASWLACDVEVVVIPAAKGKPASDLAAFKRLLSAYQGRKIIGAFSAASNASGVCTQLSSLAALVHQYGGVCIADFAAAAPYLEINMHPERDECRLDAVFFSPHKFLGGPGASGVLIFNKNLYQLNTPDQPGGGTVESVDKQGNPTYIADITQREDGGTPGTLQAVRAALAVVLKEKMGVKNILAREKELRFLLAQQLREISGLHIVEDQPVEKLGIISFFVNNLDHNDIAEELDNQFAIQVRGGISCAGYYAHHIFKKEFEKLGCGVKSATPAGWVRISLHPTMTTAEINEIGTAVKAVVEQLKSNKKASSKLSTDKLMALREVELFSPTINWNKQNEGVAVGI
ncbi:aminotransferase class V-fold PLP-dependent enzyme [Pseudoalteromonas piscicida]